MKKKRALILIIEFALLIAVMGGVFLFTQDQIEPTKVFVFKTHMATGEVISKHNLDVVEIPSSAITPNFLRTQDSVIGRVVTTDVSPGQYVMADLVTNQDQLNPLRLMDLSKMRKISFPVQIETAVAGQIKRGDVIDLIYVGKERNVCNGLEFIYGKIFMENVVVYSATNSDGFEHFPMTVSGQQQVGTTMVPGEEIANIHGGSKSDIAMITVVVTGPQAEEIAARAARGRIEILGQFAGADTLTSTGYTLGHFDEVFSGNLDPEAILLFEENEANKKED